jgi:hypothetical protein
MKLKEDLMGEACSTHGKYEKCIENFDRKSDLKIGLVKIMLKLTLRKQRAIVWTGLKWLIIETYIPLGSIKMGSS